MRTWRGWIFIWRMWQNKSRKKFFKVLLKYSIRILCLLSWILEKVFLSYSKCRWNRTENEMLLGSWQRVHSWNAHIEKKKRTSPLGSAAAPRQMWSFSVSQALRWVTVFGCEYSNFCATWDFWVSHRAASVSWHLHKDAHKVDVWQVYCTTSDSFVE